MRVVFDTNVLISAILWPDRTPARAVALARRGRIQAVTSPTLIEELREVLERKLRFGSNEIELAVEIILESSELVLPQKRIDAIQTDPDDNRVLECAVEGRADAIVTGDQHLLKLQNFRGISILSPAEFLTMLKD